MNTRWKCLICNAGVLAPTKPRKNDVRRYCLKCSKETGFLVERVAPTLEKKRELKKAVASKKSKAKRATINKKNAPAKAQDRIDAQRVKMIHKEAGKIWKLMTPYHGNRPLPKINIVRAQNRGKQYGHAYLNTIQVNVDRDQSVNQSKRVWEVLAHELAHCAVPPIYRNGSRDVHSKEFYHCLRAVWQQRWSCVISFYEVSTWGYSVDTIIQNQGEKYISWVLPTLEKCEAK